MMKNEQVLRVAIGRQTDDRRVNFYIWRTYAVTDLQTGEIATRLSTEKKTKFLLEV